MRMIPAQVEFTNDEIQAMIKELEDDVRICEELGHRAMPERKEWYQTMIKYLKCRNVFDVEAWRNVQQIGEMGCVMVKVVPDHETRQPAHYQSRTIHIQEFEKAFTKHGVFKGRRYNIR